MLAIRNSTQRSLRRVEIRSALMQSRRFAHDEHSAQSDSHPQPTSESFGKGFYASVAVLSGAVMLYTLKPADPNDSSTFITRIIKQWTTAREEWELRNTLHTKMVEQAGYDRNLFLNTPTPNYIDLRFPELFNSGAPWNVPAGHNMNLDKVIAHYKDRANKEEETKLERVRNGTPPVQKRSVG